MNTDSEVHIWRTHYSTNGNEETQLMLIQRSQTKFWNKFSTYRQHTISLEVYVSQSLTNIWFQWSLEAVCCQANVEIPQILSKTFNIFDLFNFLTIIMCMIHEINISTILDLCFSTGLFVRYCGIALFSKNTSGYWVIISQNESCPKPTYDALQCYLHKQLMMLFNLHFCSLLYFLLQHASILSLIIFDIYECTNNKKTFARVLHFSKYKQ